MSVISEIFTPVYQIVKKKFSLKNSWLYKECMSSWPSSNFAAFDCLYFLCYCLQRDHFGTVCVARRWKLLLLLFLFKIQITWPGIP